MEVLYLVILAMFYDEVLFLEVHGCIPYFLGVSLDLECVWDLVLSPSMGGGSFATT